MRNFFTENLVAFALLSLFLCAAAKASCPEVEGRYTYTCKVSKDAKSKFATVLDVSGSMLVQQTACDTFVFQNPTTLITEAFLLNDPTGKIEGKIKRSTSSVLSFKTTEDTGGLDRWIIKAVLKTTGDGFSLDGIEKGRTLGISTQHSDYDCDFKTAN